MKVYEVVDNVLADPEGYREAALAGTFESHVLGGATFHGIQVPQSLELPVWILRHYEQRLLPTLTFFRQSPEGQVEPNYIHSDREMGAWTGILYLNPRPMDGDGTTFWRHQSGTIESTAQTPDDWQDEVDCWADRAQWMPWQHVEAKFNRLLVFPSGWFHSRAIEPNYGHATEARLIQVVFGTEA